MIISKLLSGLGNQLFQYAVPRQISINKQIVLNLDTSFFDTQNLRSYKLSQFNIKSDIATESQIDAILNVYSGKQLQYKLYRRIEKFIPKYKRRLFKEGIWWGYESDVFKVGDCTYIDGYWQHYKYFEKLNPVILDELTLKYKLQDDEVKLAHEISSNNECISIHIRRGDYITDKDANNLMGILPIEYYQKSINYINDRLSNPFYYIFSDDLNWAKDNLKLGNNAKCIDISNGTKDYLELDLMSKCSHNIIANSSFSWWGAFLNRNPNKIIIAPKKWVIPEDINNRIKLQFPSWITF